MFQKAETLPKIWIDLPIKHWQPCLHFQQPIFVKQGFLQRQQLRQGYGVDQAQGNQTSGVITIR